MKFADEKESAAFHAAEAPLPAPTAIAMPFFTPVAFGLADFAEAAPLIKPVAKLPTLAAVFAPVIPKVITLPTPDATFVPIFFPYPITSSTPALPLLNTPGFQSIPENKPEPLLNISLTNLGNSLPNFIKPKINATVAHPI